MRKKISSLFNSFSIPYKKYRFRIIHRPGSWMTDSEIENLQKRMRKIAAVRLKKEPDFTFFTQKELLGNKTITICSDRKSDRDYCFCAMTHLGKYKGRNVIHLGTVFSTNADRGYMQLTYVFGLMYVFIRNWFFRKVYLTCLTHTPKIFGVVAESFESVYPNMNPRDRPSDFHHEIMEIFHDTYLKEWSHIPVKRINENFILKGFLTQDDGSILIPDTPDTVPRHRKPEYNDRVLNMLDYSSGDEVFQVGFARGFFTVLKNAYILNKV